MESDSKNEAEKQTKISNTISDDRDVPEPNGVRCRSVDLNRINRFLVTCEFGYVLPCSIFLWIIFLFFR
jgi:hypothetical protein